MTLMDKDDRQLIDEVQKISKPTQTICTDLKRNLTEFLKTSIKIFS